jgi:hypothetical protein
VTAPPCRALRLVFAVTNADGKGVDRIHFGNRDRTGMAETS